MSQSSRYAYDLPDERIARHPLPDRDGSRLLVWRAGTIADRYFRDLPDLLPADSLLIRNRSQVIPARLELQTPTGARIEIVCLEPAGGRLPEHELARCQSARWQALVGNVKRWPPSAALSLTHGSLHLNVHLEHRNGAVACLAFDWQPAEWTFLQVLEAAGAPPIPPYFKRAAEALDQQRYQTHYARVAGSVAAPTAGLHFTPEVDAALTARGVQLGELVLHVGAGTFRPLEADDPKTHAMHAELFTVNRSLLEALQKAKGPRVAVGTTSLRTLESLYPLSVLLRKSDANSSNELEELPLIEQWACENLPEPTPAVQAECLAHLLAVLDQRPSDQLVARTQLMVAPGHRFAFADALITNFHQPNSTLLVLVEAWVGPAWRDIYAHALANEYRFLSYGDSSLLWRDEQ
jgi:S-adenosylmethionine:tRNA ribosyltransferase-isomerase